VALDTVSKIKPQTKLSKESVPSPTIIMAVGIRVTSPVAEYSSINGIPRIKAIKANKNAIIPKNKNDRSSFIIKNMVERIKKPSR